MTLLEVFMELRLIKVALIAVASLALSGCTQVNTFPMGARAGDTIMIPIGWNSGANRQNITVTFQPTSGEQPITYRPNDAGVRAVVKLYPDPVSRLVVGTETQQGFGSGAEVFGNLINDKVTNQDRDWWQSVVYLDLPKSLPTGKTLVTISTPEGRVADPSAIDVLAGAGAPNDGASAALFPGQDVAKILASLERSDHYTVNSIGKTIPHSMQLDFSFTPSVGRPWVVNPRGDLKNTTWSSVGANLKVLLTPTHGFTLDYLSDFKFYVAGGLASLKVTGFKAYDVSGKPVTDIAVDLQ